MKRKLLSICIALVLALSLCLVTAVPVAAADIQVNPGESIQAAITAADPGDTIIVAAATYEEDLVIPDTKTNLELVGAEGATIKGEATFAGPFPGGIPNIEILASGVKIHGFTIESPDAVTGEYASGMLIGAANVEIYDNAFITHTQEGGQYSVVIQTYREVVFPEVDISGLNIHHNTFDSSSPPTATTVGYDGIFVNLDGGVGLVTIAGNEFAGGLLRAISVERSNVVIGGNTIVSVLDDAYQGIFIGCFELTEGGADGPVQSNVSIIGNTVEGFVQGIRVGHSTEQIGFQGIIVSQNTVEANTDGIVVKAKGGATPVDVVINYNNIVANTNFGVNNATTDNAPIDATGNWWGTTIDAEIAAMVSGDVNYFNWLEGAIDTSAVTMAGEGGEPAVTTNAATDVLLYSATLHGNLDDLGGAPSVIISFVWGTTSQPTEPYIYDSETTAAESPMSATGAFSADLTGLTHNTTYYFRAKAQIGELTRYGDELSFTTLTEQIGISVAPTSIDFGLMPIGQPSVAKLVKVENTGDVDVDLSATLANISSPDVYTTGLTMDLTSVALWGAPNVAPGEPSSVVSSLVLTVPLATAPGTYTATLIFWAEASP